VLLTDARRPPAPSGLRQVALDAPRRAPEAVWLQRSAASWLRSFTGVFHGTFNALPYRLPVPGVATIHDLSFEVHPEGFGLAKRRLFQAQARHAAKVAGCITVPSTFTRGELIQCYGVASERVVVTPWGVEPRFGPSRSEAAAELRGRLGVHGRYVVAMGGAPRRGLDVAVGAFRQVRASEPDVALVVVGHERPPPGAGVVHAGAVTDDEWAGLLGGAAAFCYPTRYEGFGVPALEGIASGTPVVCARRGSLPEVVQDAAEWCDEVTEDAFAAGLRRVLSDRDRARELRAAGLERARRHPTWDDAAEGTVRAYRAAAAAARTSSRRSARQGGRVP
jgi:glycosyltransferase involved in cell wall biosynthesis